MAGCRMEKRLVPYIHGALSAKESALVRKHVSHCRLCAEELKVLRVLENFSAPSVPNGPDIWPAVRRELLKRRRQSPWWQARPVYAIGISAAVCALIAAGWLSLNMRSESTINGIPSRMATAQKSNQLVEEAKRLPGDIITGFPSNLRDELSRENDSSVDGNTDPQLSGLMACLSSDLIQKFGPMGTQPAENNSDSEPNVKGSDPGTPVSTLVGHSTSSPQTSLEEGDELITDGDFEQSRGGLPVDWYTSSKDDAGLRFALDSKIHYWGKHSLYIGRVADSGDMDTHPNNWTQDIYRVPEGHVVKLSAYIRTRDMGLADRKFAHLSFAAIGLQCWDKDKKHTIAYASTQAKSTAIGSDWKQYTVSLKVPKGTSAISIRAILVGNGKAWFDGVSLKVGSQTGGTSTQLLENGGFETRDPQRMLPVGWFQAERPGWSGLKLYRDSKITHSGSGSICIENTNSKNQDGNNWAQVVLNPPVGKQLTFSGYVLKRSSDPKFNAVFAVQCVNKSMNSLLSQEIIHDNDKILSSKNWTHMNAKIQVPAGTYAVVVRAVAQGNGKAWFDDLSLVSR